jgi:hypothetical protein
VLGLPTVLFRLAEHLILTLQQPKQHPMDPAVRDTLVKQVLEMWSDLLQAAECAGHLAAAGVLHTGPLLERIIHLLKLLLWRQAGNHIKWAWVNMACRRALLLGAVVFAAPEEGQLRGKDVLLNHQVGPGGWAAAFL